MLPHGGDLNYRPLNLLAPEPRRIFYPIDAERRVGAYCIAPNPRRT
jgi:hypothetical protein